MLNVLLFPKVCPMEKCQRLQVDSFMRSLPPYMRANPFTHFEQNFEHYETCSPEQLAILKQRIEHKMTKEKENSIEMESPMEEQEEIKKNNSKDFKQTRYNDIKKILNQHPSLLDIFQANAM
ncbi:hypothetical protein HF086_017227 [Spodoptera exigua]|uniref:Uncharacterized protein n=1 Tax=Spodoptera exigua TaxID=7107 RepID=A0A922ME30_SPOEX|nr:hypothetical protein HF086_017227 [Spodoptera exigua]